MKNPHIIPHVSASCLSGLTSAFYKPDAHKSHRVNRVTPHKQRWYKKHCNAMKPTFPETAPKELQQEVQTLQNHYSEIVKNVGKFVLIQGEQVVDYFASYAAAVNEGFKQFGLQNFLVRPVRQQEVPIRAMRWGIRKVRGPLRLKRSTRA